MTRFLSNERTKALTDYELDVAKEVLRRKTLVGLLSEKGESLSRFFRYFGWDHLVGDGQQDCLEKNLDWNWPLKHRHETYDEGTETYDLIAKQNFYDLQLYDYARELFREQGRLFAT